MPVSATIGQSIYPYDEIILSEIKCHETDFVDSETAAALLGSSRVLNVVLHGAAAEVSPGYFQDFYRLLIR